MAGRVLPLLFEGGLNSSKAPSKIGENELAECENATVDDDTARLDPRYALKAEVTEGEGNIPPGFLSNFTVSGLGSGYARYGDGDCNEWYVLALREKGTGSDTVAYFKVDPDDFIMEGIFDGGGTYVADKSETYFQQFANYIYAVSIAHGFQRSEIGPCPPSFTRLVKPSKPSAAPGASIVSPPFATASFAGSAITATGATTNYNSSIDAWEVTYSSAAPRTVRIAFDTSPDLRPDWSYRDVVQFRVLIPAGVSDPVLYIEKDGSQYQAILWAKENVAGNLYDCWYRLQNIARANRSTVDAVVFAYDSPSFSLVRFYRPDAYGVWLSLDTGTTPVGFGPGSVTFQELRWETTYYNSATGFESDVSPIASIPASSQAHYGNWVTLTAAATGEGGVSHIRFYRVVDVGGAPVRYLIGEVANSGSPSVVDKYPLDYVTAQDIYVPSVVPSVGVRAITAWQNRLVVSDGEKVYISRDDDPLAFVDKDSFVDLTDPARALTFYPDDRKSETTLALVGQDDLYVGTEFSVRALIGNTPDNWRLIKLPDIEGVCGPRAMCPYKKGILVLTPSGRLLYHHTSLPEPIEIGEAVRDRPDDPGLLEMATVDACLEVSPSGDIHIRNQTGRYYVLSASGKWRRGTHAHPTHSMVFVSGLPERWLGTDGKLYETGDQYEDDAGTPVEWRVRTRKYLMPRSKVETVYVGGAEQTIINDTEGPRVKYPAVRVIGDRQENDLSMKVGRRTRRAGVKDSGWGLQFEFIGGKDQVLEDFRARLVPLSPGEHL